MNSTIPEPKEKDLNLRSRRPAEQAGKCQWYLVSGNTYLKFVRWEPPTSIQAKVMVTKSRQCCIRNFPGNISMPGERLILRLTLGQMPTGSLTMQTRTSVLRVSTAIRQLCTKFADDNSSLKLRGDDWPEVLGL